MQLSNCVWSIHTSWEYLLDFVNSITSVKTYMIICLTQWKTTKFCFQKFQWNLKKEDVTSQQLFRESNFSISHKFLSFCRSNLACSREWLYNDETFKRSILSTFHDIKKCFDLLFTHKVFDTLFEFNFTFEFSHQKWHAI